MIPLKFGLWHAGCKLSYLRYLTFKTLRHFHPGAKIELYIGTNCKKDGYNWRDEKQDFEHDSFEKDYIEDLKDLGVEIVKTDVYNQYQANFQSDMFRWNWLKDNGGFYLDTDQIILRSFETLPLDHNIIFSVYRAQSCGIYSPVGCIGATKDSEIVNWIVKLLPQFYNPNDYNSMGPFMFRDVLALKVWHDKAFNAPSNYFYPISDSFMVPSIYDGKLQLNDESYALHEFGGHPITQEFNKKYTPEFAKTSNDAISRFLRDHDLI